MHKHKHVLIVVKNHMGIALDWIEMAMVMCVSRQDEQIDLIKYTL